MNKALDIAGMLAILYTLGYLIMVSMLYFVEIPAANKEPLLQLFGLMSAIQMALISFYFGSSKGTETAQQTIVESKARTDDAMIEIAKAAPAPTANGGPIKTDTVNVDAQNAVVNEKEPKP